jgi:nucleoside-diphosphate kinase
MERTLGIIKPDAVSRHLTGQILARIEGSGLQIEALRLLQLTDENARQFYHVHRHRPFFTSLVAFMTSGASVVMVLKGEEAIQRYRLLMGATDPSQAAPGTLRALYGTTVEHNAVHGSDGPETAKEEIAFFSVPLSRFCFS